MRQQLALRTVVAVVALGASLIRVGAQGGTEQAPAPSQYYAEFRTPPDQVVAVRAGRLFDAKSGTMLGNQIVLIRGDRIADVGSAVPIPAEARVLDLTGATVLPGMIDTHVHVYGGGSNHHARAIAQTACVVLLVEEELGGRHPLAPFQRQADPVVTVERFPARDVPAVKPFALLDALGSRDPAGALIAVHDHLLNGKEPLELLGLVAWQLQRWVMVRRLMDDGHATAHIADVTGLRPWQAQRLQSEVGTRPLRALQALLERCWQLDTDAKRSAVIPRLAVEQLVLEICQSPVRDVSIFARGYRSRK